MLMYGLPLPETPSDEYEYYLRKYQPEDQMELFNQLCAECPMNEEQQHLFDVVTDAINRIQPDDPMIGIFCHASAGCGKTATAKKLAAYARAHSEVTNIVSSTALSSQNYLCDGSTAHSHFGMPVIEDFDRDIDDEPLQCSVSPDRRMFIFKSKFYIWDETMGNHNEVFLAVMKSFENLKGKVVLFLTDLKQTLPVIQDGTKEDILNSTIINTPQFENFIFVSLTTNMRLRNASEENRLFLQFIEAIGNNTESPWNKIFCHCENEDIKYHAISNKIKTFFDFSDLEEDADNENPNEDDTVINDDISQLKGEALNNFLFRVTSEQREEFLHTSGVINRDKDAMMAELLPNGFDKDSIRDISILAFSNKEVDNWNDYIGSLNPEEEVSLVSRDWFTEVKIVCFVNNLRFRFKSSFLNF